MKKIFLTALLMFADSKPDCYDLQIVTKNIESKYLKLSIINNSKKTLIFYDGDYQSTFRIFDETGVENSGEITSIYSGEDYLDYQFDYSKSLINKTMKKYSLSFQNAVIYLHYKNKYILIPPNQTKDVDLPIINENSKTRYKLDSTKSYFLSLTTTFYAGYIPKYIKDSLYSENLQIISPEINTKRIKINTDKFFRKHKNFYMK